MRGGASQREWGQLQSVLSSFTGGGPIGEGVWTEGGGDAMQCECGEDASASGVQFARWLNW